VLAPVSWHILELLKEKGLVKHGGGGKGLHASTFRLIVSTVVGYAGWFQGVSV
jgi:hypothetical protein